MISSLKPCPFCGALPYIICNNYRHDERTYRVRCSNNDCPVIPSTYENTEERFVIEQWNRRYKNENTTD